ncbi:MAG: hypothetical protein FJY82_01665 [Candidatus Aminicenantes bacterium]|nr:hypothetical protein [Candidatus Aminicenantes bacterium]
MKPEPPAPRPPSSPASHPPPHASPHPSRGPSSPPPPKKSHPPTDTSAETYYYLKQMGKKTPVAVVFQDGERIEGYIEWYDRNCIKLNRVGAPNLLVYKGALKYMYKLSEGKEGAEGGPDNSEK